MKQTGGFSQSQIKKQVRAAGLVFLYNECSVPREEHVNGMQKSIGSIINVGVREVTPTFFLVYENHPLYGWYQRG